MSNKPRVSISTRSFVSASSTPDAKEISSEDENSLSDTRIFSLVGEF